MLVALIYLLGLYLLIKPRIPVATVDGIVDVARGVSATIFVISVPGEPVSYTHLDQIFIN